jgi:tRNA G18 (ribose-2'-O)-methylase SpoU
VVESNDIIDKELLVKGDTRNVVDSYKNWTVEAISDDMKNRAFKFHVAIENFQHDFNIGTIVRCANAFNASGVHIIGRRHWNRRGAMSTEKYLQLYHHSTVDEFNDWSKLHNLQVIGIDNIKVSKPLSGTKLPENCVMVFGQEGPGLSDEMQQICTDIIAIEQFGSTRSVNVGVAAGIIMYAWIRQNILNIGSDKNIGV